MTLLSVPDETICGVFVTVWLIADDSHDYRTWLRSADTLERSAVFSRIRRALAEALVMMSAIAVTRAIVIPTMSRLDRYMVFLSDSGWVCTIIVQAASATPKRYKDAALAYAG